MKEDLKINVGLLEASQEALQAMVHIHNRAILFALRPQLPEKYPEKTIQELQNEISDKFRIDVAYIQENHLNSLEKIGLIRKINYLEFGSNGLSAKYALAPAGIIALDCIDRLTQRCLPLDITHK